MNSFKRNASVRWQSGEAVNHQKVELGQLVTISEGMLLIAPDAESESGPAALFAAAHASSFSIALSGQLRDVQMDSGTFLTTAVVTLEQHPAGWLVANVHLIVLATLPKITQCEFIEATVRAKTSCTISKVVRANISMIAKLEK
jgi:osmotically inducible protein OsmC